MRSSYGNPSGNMHTAFKGAKAIGDITMVIVGLFGTVATTISYAAFSTSSHNVRFCLAAFATGLATRAVAAIGERKSKESFRSSAWAGVAGAVAAASAIGFSSDYLADKFAPHEEPKEVLVEKFKAQAEPEPCHRKFLIPASEIERCRKLKAAAMAASAPSSGPQ